MRKLLLTLVLLLPFLSLTQNRVTRLDSTFIVYDFKYGKDLITYKSSKDMNPLDTSLTQDLFDGDYLYILTDNDMNFNLSNIISKTYFDKNSDYEKVKSQTRNFINEVSTDSLRNTLLVNIKSPKCHCEGSIYESIVNDVDIMKSISDKRSRSVKISYLQIYTDSGEYELIGILIKKFMKSDESYLLVYGK